MNTESNTSELLSLLRDTREQLTYFHELGVELVETGGSPSLQQTADEQPVSTTGLRIPSQPPPSVPRRDVPLSKGTKTTSSAESTVGLFGDLGPRPERIAKSAETFDQIHAEIGDCTR
ncbi:MAG: hypothetical protein ACRD6N_13420, partial [Pyrinomonadaceae bacterium]